MALQPTEEWIEYTFYNVSWSKDWKLRTPWSVDGVPMPYVGYRISSNGKYKKFVIGPIALNIIKINQKYKKAVQK